MFCACRLGSHPWQSMEYIADPAGTEVDSAWFQVQGETGPCHVHRKFFLSITSRPRQSQRFLVPPRELRGQCFTGGHQQTFDLQSSWAVKLKSFARGFSTKRNLRKTRSAQALSNPFWGRCVFKNVYIYIYICACVSTVHKKHTYIAGTYACIS